MQLLMTLIRAYPWRTAFALAAILFAGIADGAGVSTLLPLLKLFTTREPAADGILRLEPGEHMSTVEAYVLSALDQVGLQATIGVLLVFVVVFITLKSLLMLVANRHVGYSAAHITTQFRLTLLRAILATRWDYFLRQPIGRLANSMATEANRSAQAYIFGITMLAMLVMAVVYTVVALLVSWRATLACFVIGIFILSLFNTLVKMSRRAGKRQTKVYKSLLARLTDTLQSVKSLKAMAREEQADTVLSTETSKLNRALQREVFSKTLLEAVQWPMFAIVIAIGIYLALQRWGMKTETVIILVILLGRILNQLGKVQKQYQKLVSTESAFWSITRAINMAEEAREITSGTVEPALEHGIHFRQVAFSYGDKPVLTDITLELPARSLTTIVGPSGAGKTTLIDLLIGLYQPDAGAIYIDVVPLSEIDMKRWRSMIGYVPQEQLLLHDSILTNVNFGDPALTEADAEQALKAAAAWDFVSALPDGIHSNVGERGATLSGGQRQRIMIARALAHRPAVLILDEPTSALDPASETIISDTLNNLKRDYTIIAITHQQALVESADAVYRLQNGRLRRNA